jgi:hypothetical protein
MPQEPTGRGQRQTSTAPGLPRTRKGASHLGKAPLGCKSASSLDYASRLSVLVDSIFFAFLSFFVMVFCAPLLSLPPVGVPPHNEHFLFHSLSEPWHSSKSLQRLEIRSSP